MSPALLRRLANTLMLLLAILGSLWLGFGLAYAVTQDYRVIEGLYWAMQTLTTTGYGDRPPVNDTGLVLSMLLQPSAVLTTLLLGANFVKHAIEDPNAFTHEEQVEARQCDDDTNQRVREIQALLEER